MSGKKAVSMAKNGAVFVKSKCVVKIPSSSATAKAAQFSIRADEVFRAPEKVAFTVGKARWPDFYAILETSREEAPREISEAITDLAAQVLTMNLARGGGERMQLAARFLPLLRPILLNANLKTKYDAALQNHENGENSLDFEAWRVQNLTLAQRARQKGQSWLQRVRQNVANDPYL